MEKDGRLAGSLDTSFLKLVAVCAMFVDHIGATLFPTVLEFRVVGRIALPLFAWALVVGCDKTRDIWRYLGRLLALGVVSQPFYMLALGHGWLDLNILFTLSLGVLGVIGIRRRAFFSQYWAPALCLLLSCYLKIDYGWKGVLFVYLLYLARSSRGGMIAVFVGYGLFWGASTQSVTSLLGYPLPWLKSKELTVMLSCFFRIQSMIWLALPLVLRRADSGLRLPKGLMYALYPLHLMLLVLIRLSLGVPLAELTAVLSML